MGFMGHSFRAPGLQRRPGENILSGEGSLHVSASDFSVHTRYNSSGPGIGEAWRDFVHWWPHRGTLSPVLQDIDPVRKWLVLYEVYGPREPCAVCPVENSRQAGGVQSNNHVVSLDRQRASHSLPLTRAQVPGVHRVSRFPATKLSVEGAATQPSRRPRQGNQVP